MEFTGVQCEQLLELLAGALMWRELTTYLFAMLACHTDPTKWEFFFGAIIIIPYNTL